MKRNLRRKVTRVERIVNSALTVCLCLVLALGSVIAQSGTSSVSGTVVDPQGKAVAGATVKLTNSQNGFSRSQTTGENGGYNFASVPPDTYTVETEATGFKKSVVSGVKALVDKAATQEVKLEVGNITEAVTVSAASSEALINTQDASIGNNFQATQITQLPIESRNILTLLSLQPGVTPDGYVTGSRSDQANFTLDGVDVNDQQTGLDPLTSDAFSSVLRVSTETIEEFRVTTTNPNATQGRSSGAQVSLVTKSGTNEFKGSAFWYHRNTIFTANDFFNNSSIDEVTGQGVKRPKLLRNVYGATLGGPIKKEKLFFFYGFEGRRDASEDSQVRTVPLASLGRGEVRFPNAAGGVSTLRTSDLNALFPAGVNPAALAVLADGARKYPANTDIVGDGFNTGGFRFNAPISVKLETHTLKLDYNWKANQSFFLRGNYQRDLFGRAPQFPDTPSPDLWNHPLGFAAGHNWTISNSLLNNFRYGFTREAFTSQGDSSVNQTTFRFVFSPFAFSRTLSRVTPVHNFIDDLSYIKNNHSMQFGGNVRIVRNKRTTFANSFDSAIANPSFYDESGAVLSDPIDEAVGIAEGFTSGVQAAVSAVIGRYSDYAAIFNFGADGELLPAGTGIGRKFATEEYDFYAQDSWKIKQNLTLTYGLRYGVSRPVYESNGLQVKPTTSLGAYFEKRKASALTGLPFNDPITVDLAGPKNGRPGYYAWDKNNLQPRVALAWSPNFSGGFLKKFFGEGDSVIRGGFAMTNDAFGQQLAVNFDLNNTLGFSSTEQIAANTFNVSDRPGPRFTGIGQNVRNLPFIPSPSRLVFPLQTPADQAQRIEESLDDTLVTPTNYSWTLSYGRKVPGSIFVEASYVGRAGRNLLATRDIMALNNIVDPKSGLDWYTAARQLAALRLNDTPITSVQPIAYFENLFPAYRTTIGGVNLTPTQRIYRLVAREGVGGLNILDWTFVQAIIDDRGIVPNMFFHPQYAALSTFSTVASSDYHAGTLTVRQRYHNTLDWDLNYTYSRSIDDASGLQTSGGFGAAFILNPLRPKDNRAASDFDITHIVNANAIYQLPFGKGKAFLSGANRMVDGVIGGWQLSSIFRWNSGQFVPGSPFDQAQWATNWNVQSSGVRTGPLVSSPTRGGGVKTPNPNLFEDPVAVYRSLRNALPGETGDRNFLRAPSYIVLDMGLSKSFNMPWESHKLQFRWEVFNVTNTQRLTLSAVTRANFGLDIDPQLGTPPPVWGNLDVIQGTPRVMQFGLRYSF